MIAVIGSGKKVITAPTTEYEYNTKTYILVLLHEDLSKTVIDTRKDKVIIKDGSHIVDKFNGVHHAKNN